MDHLDSKYIGFISSRLGKFKRVKSDLYNFRCPICGDSKKHKNKARGYIYPVKTNTNFKCHNCGASMSFNNFLKQVDPVIHKQYSLEKFKEGHTGRNFVIDENPKSFGYLTARKLDPSKFYYAEKFKEFVNTLKLTFNDTRFDEERIIIPLYFENNLIGIQGRSIKPNPVKYITVMLDDDVTEGPFDSTFISNAIAMCGADADVNRWGISNRVWIYDNEPRSREITNRISKAIDSGESVVIFPSHIDEKDINDMAMAGYDVQELVKCNTYSGLEAKLKFNT